MKDTCRLPPPWGNLIDRNEVIEFEFDGKGYQGCRGDTISSALAANGRLMMSRSFKYHRPRGSASFAGWDANSYVQVGDEPNVQGDLTLISPGLSSRPQNVWGTLDRDLAAVAHSMRRFLPVGFYYRSFFRPRGVWPVWERLARRAAGLGRVNPEAKRQSITEKEHLFTDLAVIGSGPAGISAALAAANEGMSVLLVEEAPVLGGSLNYARFGRLVDEVASLRERLVQTVTNNAHVRVLRGATCSGWFADNWLSIHNRSRLFKVRAARVVLATGSVEQPAVFRNNDLPGVMTGSSAQRLMRVYGVKPGTRAVLLNANADGLDVVKDLTEADVEVAEIIDLRTSDLSLLQALSAPGNKRVIGIEFTERGKVRRIECDLIVTSVGYAPLGQLACHSGGNLVYDPNIHAFKIVNCPRGGAIAGSLNHRYELNSVIADGEVAGLGAAGKARKRPSDNSAESINHPYPIFTHPKGDEYVDFDEDQTVQDLVNAVADGFNHPELAKRYSTAGMGPSQGRMSATNALRIVSKAAGTDCANLMATTQRPPFRPIPASVLAERMSEPERRTAMHDWHVRRGATMMPAGRWQRPAYYGADREQSIEREVAAVRNGVGIIDLSTLGGIELRGPDAAEFLSRMYTLAYLNQPVHRTRYVLMTDDAGSIVDDGVAVRLAKEHFYVTTTTTGSDSVFRTMLKRAILWRMRVEILNATSLFAVINVVGPESRAVIESLRSDIDFSAKGFPYLATRVGNLAEISTRAMRVGFVGELGYELHVPWSRGLHLWNALLDAGKSKKICPVGIEAQRVLRLEKGHIIVGQDTDALTKPIEANLGWAVKRSKPCFVGRTAIACLEAQPPFRRLVGFELPQGTSSLPEECNLVLRGNDIVGRVTSIARSKVLNKDIGLAYVHPGDERPGSMISIKLGNGQRLSGTVVELPFLDPKGERQAL